MRSYLYVFFYSVLLLVSCSNKEDEPVGDISFCVDTKAITEVADNPTYRVMMYGEKDRGYKYTGTYYMKPGVPDLVACKLTDEGVFDGEDPSMGINGISDKVFLVLASPGVLCNEDGSFDFVPDINSNFFLNEPELKTIGGYGSVVFTKPLYNPRSTIGFMFYKKPGVEDFSVEDAKVKLTGIQSLNENVKLYPALRQVKMASSRQERELILTEIVNHIEDPDMNNYKLFYTTGEKPIFVASGIYAPRQDVINYLNLPISSNIMDGDYVYMACTIVQGGRGVDVRMPLTDQIKEFKPQFNYVYRIIVESDYIGVELDIYDTTNTTNNDWQLVGNSSSNLGALSKTISIGRWTINGWQQAGNIDFTIGEND